MIVSVAKYKEIFIFHFKQLIMSKPKVFIGSSVEGLKIAYAVQQNLHYSAEVTVWDQGIFELSRTTIESLVSILDNSDFGIFVFSPDDILKIRNKKFLAVRDNVVFELSLFIGRLGRERSFILIPEKTDFHLPSDLLGVTPALYEKDRTDGSFQAATAPACQQIRNSIEKIGSILINVNDRTEIEEHKVESNKESDKNDPWISLFVEKKWQEGIKEIEKLMRKEKNRRELIVLVSWKCYGQYMKEFEILINKHKSSYIPSLFLVRTLRWEGLYDRAMIELEKALKKFPDNKELTLEKVECYRSLGKSEELKELLNSHLNKDKDDQYFLELFEVL